MDLPKRVVAVVDAKSDQGRPEEKRERVGPAWQQARRGGAGEEA